MMELLSKSFKNERPKEKKYEYVPIVLRPVHHHRRRDSRSILVGQRLERR